jgi:hypothetical protein
MQTGKTTGKINIKALLILLIGLSVFTLIIAVTMLEAGKAARKSKADFNKAEPKTDPKVTGLPAADYDSKMTGVVAGIDYESKTITLLNTDTQKTVALTYGGSSDIRDKFGQVVTIKQIPVGQIIDAGYNEEDKFLVKLSVSSAGWEYIGVNNLDINPGSKEMRIASQRYRYTGQVMVLDNGELTGVENLAPQDELTVRGIDETIWSITVTKGHGTVRITNADAFIGGNVTVGYEAMQPVGEDTVITVREGTFDLTVENGKYSGTKMVTVLRNEETVVSLGDLGPEPIRYGMVAFQINPFGADLFIDNELTFYGDPVELEYGLHSIRVALGGYVTYEGELKVDSAGKKISISLPEEKTNEEAVASESEDGGKTGDSGSEQGTAEGIKYNKWVYPIVTGGISDEEDDFLIDEAHSIFIQNPTDASVYLNGDFVGISPGSFQKIIGSFVLTFIREGYVTMSYTVEVRDDGLDTYISLPDLIPYD